MTVIDLDKVAALLRDRHGIPNAYVEQTGGGCATLYAGPEYLYQPDEPRYTAAAGPGWFDGPGWSNARATLADFYIGRDDCGETFELAEMQVPLSRAEDESAIAEKIATFIAEHPVPAELLVPAAAVQAPTDEQPAYPVFSVVMGTHEVWMKHDDGRWHSTSGTVCTDQEMLARIKTDARVARIGTDRM